MRKYLWAVPLLLLFSVIGATSARADTYIADFTCPSGSCDAYNAPTAEAVGNASGIEIVDLSWLGVAIPLQENLASGSLPTDLYGWDLNYAPDGLDFIVCDINTGCGTSITVIPVDDIPTPNDLTLETHEGGSLTFSPVPDPGSIGLTLLGIGLVLVMRKRTVALAAC